MAPIASLAMDYFNNFLSVKSFAEHYEISEELARLLIKEGLEINDNHAHTEKTNLN